MDALPEWPDGTVATLVTQGDAPHAIPVSLIAPRRRRASSLLGLAPRRESLARLRADPRCRAHDPRRRRPRVHRPRPRDARSRSRTPSSPSGSRSTRSPTTTARPTRSDDGVQWRWTDEDERARATPRPAPRCAPSQGAGPAPHGVPGTTRRRSLRDGVRRVRPRRHAAADALEAGTVVLAFRARGVARRRGLERDPTGRAARARPARSHERAAVAERGARCGRTQDSSTARGVEPPAPAPMVPRLSRRAGSRLTSARALPRAAVEGGAASASAVRARRRDRGRDLPRVPARPQRGRGARPPLEEP